jgi:hypothetical protein
MKSREVSRNGLYHKKADQNRMQVPSEVLTCHQSASLNPKGGTGSILAPGQCGVKRIKAGCGKDKEL